MTNYQSVAFSHTVSSLVATFQGLADAMLPGMKTTHLVNESLLRDLIACGSSPELTRRIVDHILQAAATGADVVIATCSSTSAAVDVARLLTSTPILKVDDPMAERAVRLGSRIGLVCTAKSTVEPSSDLLVRHGREAGCVPVVTVGLESRALESLRAGDRVAHDELVTSSAVALAETSDVIVLAQASMAHLQQALSERTGKPVLASPAMLIEHLAVNR